MIGSIVTLGVAGNPFFRELIAQCGGRIPTRDAALDVQAEHPGGSSLRDRLLARYAHTISDPGTVGFVIKYVGGLGGGKMVSIGAGTGYWEGLLAQIVEVTAFDIAPPDVLPNKYHGVFDASGSWGPTPLFHPVNRGGPERAAEFPDYALFLSWPPPGPLAHEALQAYTGNLLVFMGVPKWNGNPDFYKVLDSEWELIDYRIPVRWRGIQDAVYVFCRRTDSRLLRRATS